MGKLGPKLAAALVFGAIAASFGGASAEDLKLGVVGSLSGGGTEWGLATQRGVELAIAEVAGAGGLKIGNTTYTPKMIMYDDQYTGTGGTTAATRLVKVDGVKFIIGPVGSPAVLGVLGVTRPAKVVVLSNGFSPNILTPESKYNFRVSLTTSELAPQVTKWLRGKLPKDVMNVGIILPNDSVGQSVAPVLVNAYQNAGFKVIFDERYSRGSPDFTPLLTRMISRGVEVLEITGNAPGEVGLLIKQARQLGYKGTITAGPGYAEEAIKIAGPLAKGFISYEIFDPDDPAAASFVKAYRAKYDGPINQFAPIMYNATKILFEALRR
ncbi:MAG: ABC transporter substrate-binding protein, partial [Longimicrobiales bacterium]